MKSFAMLWTSPIRLDVYDPSERRYFIDGKRVSQGEYDKLTNQAKRHDCFQTYSFAGRWHNRSVVHV